jgi:hypothetical protein
MIMRGRTSISVCSAHDIADAAGAPLPVENGEIVLAMGYYQELVLNQATRKVGFS